MCPIWWPPGPGPGPPSVSRRASRSVFPLLDTVKGSWSAGYRFGGTRLGAPSPPETHGFSSDHSDISARGVPRALTSVSGSVPGLVPASDPAFLYQLKSFIVHGKRPLSIVHPESVIAHPSSVIGRRVAGQRLAIRVAGQRLLVMKNWSSFSSILAVFILHRPIGQRFTGQRLTVMVRWSKIPFILAVFILNRTPLQEPFSRLSSIIREREREREREQERDRKHRHQ